MFAGSLKSRIGRAIRGRQFYWHYVANLKPSVAYYKQRPSLSKDQRDLLARLKRDGIVVTNVDRLFPNGSLIDELEAAVRDLEAAQSEHIEARRQGVDSPGLKSYLVELLGSQPSVDVRSAFVRFALQPDLLSLANSYLGMHTRLSFFNVWHNVPTTRGPINAQLWHRDLDDRMIFKLFIYLTDVTESNGPLVYAPGTHSVGRNRREPETFGEQGTTARRSNDEQMNRVVPRQKWITAVGPKHTVTIVDTSGFHRGGFVERNDRIVYTCMFTSQASQLRAEYLRRPRLVPADFDTATAFALGSPA